MLWSVAIVLAVALASCARPPDLELQSISGIMLDLQFQLTDDGGRAVSAKSYSHKAVLLSSGYTHCPDVCPITLAVLSRASKGLGSAAANVRVLFCNGRSTP